MAASGYTGFHLKNTSNILLLLLSQSQYVLNFLRQNVLNCLQLVLLFCSLLVCFACFCFVAVHFFFIGLFVVVVVGVCVCVCVCTFKFIFIFPSFFILCAVFISLRVRLGLFFHWSETRISYFGVVYKKFLSVGMEWAVINKLFIILYI